MKCAEAKTRLSFVTATLNSLRAGIAPSPCRAPAALRQCDEDRGGGEVRRGARILGIAPVAELGVEGLERLAPGGAAHAAGLRHVLRPPRDRDRRPRSSAARAKGESSSTMPRLELRGTHRAVASIASRMVRPSGCSPARPKAGPMAAALARKSW